MAFEQLALILPKFSNDTLRFDKNNKPFLQILKIKNWEIFRFLEGVLGPEKYRIRYQSSNYQYCYFELGCDGSLIDEQDGFLKVIHLTDLTQEEQISYINFLFEDFSSI